MDGDNPFEVSEESYGDRATSSAEEGVEVSSQTVHLLSQTRPWVMFIGILIWIATVMTGLVGVGMIVGGLVTGNMEMALLSVVYLVLTLIYAIMAVYLTSYASRIKTLMATEKLRDLEETIDAQRKFWKVVGIMTLVYLVGMVLLFAGALVFGAMANF